MSDERRSDRLTDVYADRIGTPRTDDEVRGYWLFALGVVLTFLGVILYTAGNAGGSGPGAVNYAYRQFGVVLSGIGAPVVMLGSIVRFPLRKRATTLATIGTGICVVAIAWFVVVYPGSWTPGAGHTGVMALYALGILLIALAGAIVPIVTDPVYEEHEQLQETAAGTTAELEETETRVRELEEELAATEGELESVRSSRARFELYEDAADEYRWRLRHRNGNVIADSGQGYSSRQKCQQGMHSVMRNALGAGVLRIEPAASAADGEAADDGDDATDGDDVSDEEDTAAAGDGTAADVSVPDDADDPDLAVPSESVASQSRFELFEDTAGEWRWRLRHDNGNVLGDSGEGYASRPNAVRAMNGVRSHVASADYLRIDPTAFELYRDAAGEYRWRLIHENGEILADSGQGYSSRSKARQGIESVRSNATDAPLETLDDE
ncbi:Uncharacterized conserved protein YegP, UPF0339 family [Halopenitus persicus]|uniref:Uncharacterized conserved protein YegP, UPF0339 family n=1 Tax=Halopenitus persicus TaxID=1048396 RepID=A0A1H3EML0_9EURY|nr:Uncharacterized conserved protein YegP, UPF0339 family [Halopenitus persicus]